MAAIETEVIRKGNLNVDDRLSIVVLIECMIVLVRYLFSPEKQMR